MYLKSSFGRVYYEVHGPDDSRPAADPDSRVVAGSAAGKPEPLTVLFAHGVTMDHRTFASQVDALKGRFRVACLDLPGHGRSDRVDLKGPYSSRAANAINEVLDALGAKRVVLVGQSLGSTLCQRAASESQDRVVGSVHVGGASLYPRFSPLLRLVKPAVFLSITLFPRKPLYELFAAHKALKPHTRAYLREVVSAAGKTLILRLTLDMLRDMTVGIPRRLDHPMLICYGDHEAGFVKRLCRTWRDAQPNSSLEVIGDAHHIANQDNPSAFNELLIRFLGSVDGAAISRPHRPEAGARPAAAARGSVSPADQAAP